MEIFRKVKEMQSAKCHKKNLQNLKLMTAILSQCRAVDKIERT